DAAWRYDAVLQPCRRHASDRKAVAPVNVRHPQRVADDAPQMRDVHDLLQAGVCRERSHLLRRRENAAWHAHPASPGDLPQILAGATDVDRHTSKITS